MLKRILAIVVIVTLAAAACGDDSGTADSATAAAGLGLSGSSLGEIVVDAPGNTVYIFMPDAQGESTCYDQCEANWPIVSQVDAVGAGLDSSLLSSIVRSTGEVQATYNSWPLYHLAHDAAAGDTNGQGVNSVWFVIDATPGVKASRTCPLSAVRYARESCNDSSPAPPPSGTTKQPTNPAPPDPSPPTTTDPLELII